MNIGMLWFDNDPKAEMAVKIERAAAYYREKYGKKPNLCYVHPSMLRNDHSPETSWRISSAGVEVRPSHSVLPNHFWIGVNGSIPNEPSSS